MKSIGTKLIITFISVFFFGIAAVSAVLIILSSISSKELTLRDMKFRMKLQAIEMEQLIVQRASVMDMTAEIIIGEDSIDGEYIQSVISPIYEVQSEYNLYVGFENNEAYFADLWEPDESWHATERDWYVLGKANPGETVSTAPYVDSDTGEICITLVHGMVKDGKFLGVVALDIYQDALYGPLVNSKYLLGSQYLMLLNDDGYIYYHPDESLAPSIKDGIKNLKDMGSGKYLSVFEHTADDDITAVTIKNFQNKASYFIAAEVDGTDWIICGVILASEMNADMVRQIVITVSISLASILAAVFIIFFIVRRMIIMPINNMVDAAMVMAVGDTEVNVNTDSKDELGKFGRAFQTIIDDTKSNVKAVQAIAGGDLTQSIRVRSDKDVMGLALTTMLETNNEIMGDISQASSQVSVYSRQVSDVGQMLATGAQEQSGAVDRLSASVRQIYEITKDNLQLSESAVKLSGEIIRNAERGGEKMSEMLKAVEEIREASRSIESVIHTIDNIAFQTNILALNAAVEAARAGQHGKGFAVVAEEVRSLASKSAEAAQNTGALISNSMEKAELGSKLASETSAAFGDIVSGVRDSTDKINEISSYSKKQVGAIKIISDELKDVQRVAQQNSASAEETASTGVEMNEQSAMLQELIGRFKVREDQKQLTE